MITVYTMPSCGHCHELLDYLKENNYIFEQVDCSLDQDKAISIVKRTGQQQVPIMVINEGTDKENYLIGFNKESVDQFISQFLTAI